ncbi:Asp23/Gls24 family envelope stress response protein [Actinokineospora iranica]|uniref:Asp23 family, cell envelope-related function n=1 Tax=Actinokineospora iranica TaxID=1271860 RepID=A0A1G6LJS8_9PSEU|nr:Asp23/Gls24 family envelope stress response protein [Actinokineospora iranica]SDC43424.1 hypothetical protein SAMN05216174_102108 [Actinokineospora iranica]
MAPPARPTDHPPDRLSATADAVGAAVLGHPAVVRLDGGAFGTVATHLPGRRVVGVQLGGPGDTVTVSVVLALGAAIPEVGDQLRERVRAVAGPVPVDVHVNDVEPLPVESPPTEPVPVRAPPREPP